MTLKEKREKRAALLNQQRALIDSNPNGMSAEVETQYENIETDYKALDKAIKREEGLESVENSLRQSQAPAPVTELNNGLSDKDKKRAEYKSAFFDNYIRRGQIKNALQVGTDSEGGYLVPEEWAANIVKALSEVNVVRRYARSIATMSDRNIPIRAGRASFGWIAEEGTYTKPDPSFGNVLLQAHKLGGIILVSDELLADSAYNLEGELAADAAEEFGFREEVGFLTGDNSGKPNGLFEVASVGGVSLTGTTAASTTAVTADEMIDTYYGLAKSYRARATWVTSDTVEKALRKLKDSDGQYLWQPSLQAGAPATFLGRPFETSDGAPDPAAGERSIIFGDLGYYQIVDRLNMTVKRLNELYAETGQTGYQFTKRVDGELTLAPAVTFLQQAAS